MGNPSSRPRPSPRITVPRRRGGAASRRAARATSPSASAILIRDEETGSSPSVTTGASSTANPRSPPIAAIRSSVPARSRPKALLAVMTKPRISIDGAIASRNPSGESSRTAPSNRTITAWSMPASRRRTRRDRPAAGEGPCSRAGSPPPAAGRRRAPSHRARGPPRHGDGGVHDSPMAEVDPVEHAERDDRGPGCRAGPGSFGRTVGDHLVRLQDATVEMAHAQQPIPRRGR